MPENTNPEFDYDDSPITEEQDRLYPYLMSERALSDWLRPEEDDAWAHLQQDNPEY